MFYRFSPFHLHNRTSDRTLFSTLERSTNNAEAVHQTIFAEGNAPPQNWIYLTKRIGKEILTPLPPGNFHLSSKIFCLPLAPKPRNFIFLNLIWWQNTENFNPSRLFWKITFQHIKSNFLESRLSKSCFQSFSPLIAYVTIDVYNKSQN